MSIHHHLEYESELDDPEEADEIMERFFDETNAEKQAPYFDYLLTEDDGNRYVNEIGTMDGNVKGRRALVTDEYVIEGVLDDELAEEIKERYEELEGSYSSSSL